MTFPRPLGEMGAVARDVAAAGFDGVLFTEGGRTAYLSAAVTATSAPTMAISTGVAVAFPRSPMVTAQVAWELQEATAGKFRLGLDKLIEDKEGNSLISREDFAVAIMDELEKGKHIRKRFTAAY